MQEDSLYKRYLLTVLLVILTFNYVDRLVLGLVLQDIKVDFHLSDTQLGLLTGITFAVFYSVMGIPIARWADRGNRVTIIALAVAVWSLMVALCGRVGSFAQLLLVRIGVGVGEAGCIPPAHSLIADNFTRSERPRAFGIYMLGGALSPLVGYFWGGWLNELYGWRVTFTLLGLPGLVLVPLAWLTLKEPRAAPMATQRRSATLANTALANTALANTTLAGASPNAEQAGLKEVCVTLWSNTTFRHLMFSLSVGAFFSAGILQWQPAFFVRSYGMRTGELGTWFALIYGTAGLLGTYWGGALASRYAAHNERAQLRAIAVADCGFAVLAASIYLAPDRHLAFALMGVASLGGATVNGPLFAAIQTLVPQNMRAVSIALVLLCTNLVGLGLGPLAAGALSDLFRPWVGEESLRYALLALCPGYLWAGWHLWRASRSVLRDLEAAQVSPGASKENFVVNVNA
jgi:MFS family permease